MGATTKDLDTKSRSLVRIFSMRRSGSFSKKPSSPSPKKSSANKKKDKYDREAEHLFRLLNLPKSGDARKGTSEEEGLRYKNLNAIYKDPMTGGTVFVGNRVAASESKLL